METQKLLFRWLLGLVELLGNVGTWLTEPFYQVKLNNWFSFDMTPLGLFTATGFTLVLALHIWHLVKPVG